MRHLYCLKGKLCIYVFHSLLLFLALSFSRPAGAQTFQPLSIGDTVPDLAIGRMLHSPHTETRLSDFKGKLLILDFWATWCGPCISMIPRIDSLQEEYRERVQFLPVTYQTEKEVTTFMAKYNQRNPGRIARPEVTGDTILKQLFPHSYLPHYVWIGPDGLIKAITGSNEITANRIKAYLQAGKTPDSPVSAPIKPYNKIEEPLMSYFTGAEISLPDGGIYAFRLPFVEGLGGGYHLDKYMKDTTMWRITFTNIAPIWLYKVAYGEAKSFLSDSFCSIEINDPVQLETYFPPAPAKEWFRKNAICLELVVTKAHRGQAWSLFREELAKIFPQFHAEVVTRKTSCFALVRTSDFDKIQTRGGKTASRQDGMTLQIRNGSLQKLVTRLGAFYRVGHPKPLVDQTGYTGRVDLDLSADFSNIEDVNTALARYDLKFVEKETDLPILKIRDRGVPQ